jgi:hypothetical protein
MRTTSRFAICLVATTLVSCAKSEQAKDTTAATGAAATTPATASTPAAPAPPTAVSLADVAGKWTIKSTPVDGKDTTVMSYILTATADTTGWTRTNQGAKPVPVHVRTDADSIITRTGPFASTRRKGQQVTSESVLRLQGGRLVGTSTGHYKSAGADSVAHFRLEGTKTP